MNKKLILVAAPPACGKTYVSELIAKSMGNLVYLDKDDLSDLISASFKVAGKEVDMDGDFYINNIRSAEYSTVLNIAFSSLRFEDNVLLNAPFGKEVRNAESMRLLKEKSNEMGAELLLIWVTASTEVCHERMIKRNASRDLKKLKSWKDYVKKINFVPPYELEKQNAVDKFIIFDANSDETTKQSLAETLKIIKGG